jgi:acetyl-CoA synthetase
MAWPTTAPGETAPGGNPPVADNGFSWTQATAELAGLPDGRGLNIAYEAVDRHVAEGHGTRVALRLLPRQGRPRDITYAELAARTNRCAAMLAQHGLEQGETVALLLGRGLDFVVAALGVLKAGGVICPLFPVLGPEPIRARLSLSGAGILITTPDLFERKIRPLRHLLPELETVLVTDPEGAAAHVSGAEDFHAALESAPAGFAIPPTDPQDPALLHFTSGTTGIPKGAVHAHAALAGQRFSGRLALGLTPEDVFWCTADPGWVTGTVYGLLVPLAIGCTSIIDPQGFDASRWYTTLSTQRVSVFYTTPTAIRMLMRFGAALARTHRFPALRVAASVGEPLNPEAVHWGREALGTAFLDTWWQTETGCITIANLPGRTLKPGSMGRPLPGFTVALVSRADTGALEMVEDPETVAEIAIKVGPPSLFSGYFGEPERTHGCFVDGWYLTGDLARRDADRYYWFVGRKDDVIKSSGHLIGPFEVEGALMDHPAVAEAGVIGRSDPLLHEVVVGYVTLNPGFDAGEALRRELLAFARDRLGPALAPRDVLFAEELPKTNSGKIMRRVLRSRDQGLTEGDLVQPMRVG